MNFDLGHIAAVLVGLAGALLSDFLQERRTKRLIKEENIEIWREHARVALRVGMRPRTPSPYARELELEKVTDPGLYVPDAGSGRLVSVVKDSSGLTKKKEPLP